MIAIDTSAIVAILFDEADAASYAEAIARAGSTIVGTPTLLEASVVLRRAFKRSDVEKLDELVAAARFEVRPFGLEHLTVARDAFRRFGRGSMHPARLNFGDCFAYAVAKLENVPLLFKGDDFSKTDLERVATV